MAIDNSILTGGGSAEPSQADFEAMDDSVGPQPEGVVPADAPEPQAAPIPTALSGQPANIPTLQATAPVPATAGTPSVWKNIVAGALAGLAGSAGATHFGGGAAMGAASELAARQQRTENANKQKGLQFEELRAADAHIAALHAARAADEASEDHKIKIKMDYLNYSQTMKAFGFEPDIVVSGEQSDDMHAQAAGGLQTLAVQNGGKIPNIATVNSPASQGDPKHIISVFSPSPKDIQQNPNGSRKIVDQVREVQGLPATTDLEWNGGSGLGKPINGIPNPADGQRQMVITAMQSLTTPPPSQSTGENAAISAHLQQQLDTYKKSPTADPAMVKRLQNQVDTFNGAVADAQGKANTALAATKQAEKAGELRAENSDENIAAEAKRKGADAAAVQKVKIANAVMKPENMLVGSMPDGSQVAGTVDDLQAAGATSITKLDADTAKKVIVSRQMIAPNGLFAAIYSDLQTLDKAGKLGVVATRWSNFMTKKVGSGPEYSKLYADMGLFATALMQAHVGARASAEMLEHFKALADYRISDAATLRAALEVEYNYVTEKAMFPKKKAQ
jgi:hypothetical protein